jgi:hypothetical protein
MLGDQASAFNEKLHTGVSVRFFNDMIPTGQGGIGKVTGSTLR